MQIQKLIAIAVCACAGSPILAQSPRGVVLNGGYRLADNPKAVAPAQILNLPVVGLELSSSNPIVQRGPGTNRYPFEADGVRVVVRGHVTSAEWPARIINLVRQTCAQLSSSCEPVSTATVLLPSELQALATNEDNGATLLVYKNDILIALLPLTVVQDQLHILNSCDETGISISLFGPSPVYPPCVWAVTHVTGYRITTESPAVPGETVVIWVYGGGAPNPDATVNVGGARLVGLHYTPQIALNYGVNARPMVSPFANGGPAVPSLSAATFEGFGLTQINFVLPSPPSGISVPACNGRDVRSNLSITVFGPASSDGAAVCVRP